MNFAVDVDETIYRSTTYVVKAKSKKEAKTKVAGHNWNEMVIIKSNDYDGHIDEIHNVKRYVHSLKRRRCR